MVNYMLEPHWIVHSTLSKYHEIDSLGPLNVICRVDALDEVLHEESAQISMTP